MIATIRSKHTPQPERPTTTRPVRNILLELAYHLHATKAIGTRPEPDWRPRKSR